jgi:hypothetical protein
MAKKKSKKTTQKQVEVETPLESIKPVAATSTEPDSTATPEAEPQPTPTPLEAANDEAPLSGSTPVPDQNVEAVQDHPIELEPSTVAESTIKSEETQPSTLDHVDESTAAPEELTVVSMGESQSHVPTEEEPQPSAIEAEALSHIGPSDASEILPEAVADPVITASEEPDTLLNGESQAEADGAQPAELPSLTVTESVVTDREILDDNQPDIEAPVTVESHDDPSHLEGTISTKADVDTEQPYEYARILNCTLPLD